MTLCFLHLLRRCKVFILQGRLFHILTLVVFKELQIVITDSTYMTYLPVHFTKTSGSVKALAGQAMIKDTTEVRAYMISFAKLTGMSAVTFENILCKFQVAYFGPKAKLSNKKRGKVIK